VLAPQNGKHGSNLAATPSARKPRALKTYKNPHTGEVVETKGGNHKTLKKWKVEYSSEEVESWLFK